MSYLTIVIALGIIVLFGYWSGKRRRKSQRRPNPKINKLYSLARSEKQTKLRRIK
jgi:uncharacterized protein YneF (UPF0154 family)